MGRRVVLNFGWLSFSEPAEGDKRKSGETLNRVEAGRMGIMALG